MYYFAAAPQTSAAKLPVFFQRFQIIQTKVHALKVNKTKITTDNNINRDHFGIEDNHE